MGSKKKPSKRTTSPTPPTSALFDQARDELFSHILRCGVIEADADQQAAWMDDTMQYIAERYFELTEEELGEIRVLGDRFCRPVVRHQHVGA